MRQTHQITRDGFAAIIEWPRDDFELEPVDKTNKQNSYRTNGEISIPSLKVQFWTTRNRFVMIFVCACWRHWKLISSQNGESMNEYSFIGHWSGNWLRLLKFFCFLKEREKKISSINEIEIFAENVVKFRIELGFEKTKRVEKYFWRFFREMNFRIVDEKFSFSNRNEKEKHPKRSFSSEARRK